MTVDNIVRCNSCRAALIAEESEYHQCSKPTEVWVIDGQVWIGNGQRFYPLTNRKSTTESNNGRFNTTIKVVS